jgi:hypothetical protein
MVRTEPSPLGPRLSTMIALMLITSIPGLVPLLILVAAIDRMGLVANRRLRLP